MRTRYLAPRRPLVSGRPATRAFRESIQSFFAAAFRRSTRQESPDATGIAAHIPLRRRDSEQFGATVTSRTNGCLYLEGTTSFGIVYTGKPSDRYGSVAVVAPGGSGAVKRIVAFVEALRRANIHGDVYVCHVPPELTGLLVEDDFELLVPQETGIVPPCSSLLPEHLRLAVDAFVATNPDTGPVARLGTRTLVRREVSPFWFWRNGQRVPSYLLPRHL
jgi:hypothetical protein